ncbi:MAG: regulatory signaling modulator protein AmpE [Gammaproteobacteria bacterium]
MSMIVIIAAVLLEHFLSIFRPLRRLGWFDKYETFVQSKIPASYHGLILLAAIIIPSLIVVLLLQVVFSGLLYSIGEFVFQLAVLLYCLGNSTMRQEVEECNALLKDGEQEKLDAYYKETFHMALPDGKSVDHAAILDALFVQANQRLFGVVFWFAILGPIGAVLYRFVQHLGVKFVVHNDQASLYKSAAWFASILDWVPARLLSFTFGLIGHFVSVFPVWCQFIKVGLNQNDQVLFDCGKQALSLGENDEELVAHAQQDAALGLINRSLLVWLVVIALVVLV